MSNAHPIFLGGAEDLDEQPDEDATLIAAFARVEELEARIAELEAQLADAKGRAERSERDYQLMRNVFDLNPTAAYARVEQAEAQLAEATRERDEAHLDKDAAILNVIFEIEEITKERDAAEAREAKLREELDATNSKKAKATALIAKYKPALEAYAKPGNWYKATETSERRQFFDVYQDGRWEDGWAFAAAALQPAPEETV